MARKTKMRMSDVVLVYADASYCSSTAAWGYGYCILVGEPVMRKTYSGGSIYCVSSQQAEMMAVREALDFLRVHMTPMIRGRQIEVRSDCLGAIAAIRKEAQEFIDLTGVSGVALHHVRSHSGRRDAHSQLNYLCHCLAKQAMAKYRARVSKHRARKRGRHRGKEAPEHHRARKAQEVVLHSLGRSEVS